MLRTIAFGLTVAALIAGPATAQPPGGTNSTSAATTKHPDFQSHTKSMSKPKQTNTTNTEKIVEHDVDHRARRHAVHHRGNDHQHLVGRITR